jgi:hypothetical protein
MWGQYLSDIHLEHCGIGGAVHRHDGIQPMARQATQDRDIASEVFWHRIMHPRPMPTPTIASGHRNIAAGFVNKFQAVQGAAGKLPSVLLACQ